ncbi:hypothetical protein BU23DRAFT_461196 [Bimuria novae-zelandiae CBS 107.79]|uniref:HTH CENPB-type domain-containing protein n=1 Tax=Bimuria novae-zelandiae CBS 107.79 TaxID=1447943 RepID=A0A6A5VE70_9PLEO|nr:hypothetical protein BU23DRAFT_461196 [Bimuria novae-zelandiae CBS 107.79]
MGAIEDEIEAIQSLDPGEKFSYRKIAATYGVDRTTLSRRHKRVQAPNEAKNINQQKLTPQQEQELVRYIEGLTKRHTPPTREMIQNFASTIAKEPVSESWVTRFIN